MTSGRTLTPSFTQFVTNTPAAAFAAWLGFVFVVFFSIPLFAATPTTTGDAAATEAAPEALVPPPDFILNPGSGKSVELIYRGLRGLLPARLDVPNPETVEDAYLEVVYKGKLPSTNLHSAIVARVQGGRTVTLTPKLIQGNWGSNGVAAFTAMVGKTDRVNLDFEVEEGSAQSALLYVVRNDAAPGTYQAGVYASFFGYEVSKTFNIPLPSNDQRAKDILVTIPVSEITTDGRVLDFVIKAGEKVIGFRRTWGNNFPFDNECCIDTVQARLHNVSAASKVEVTVISPKRSNPRGQSFVISGVVQAEVSPTCAPLPLVLPNDVCTDNTVTVECASPGAGYTAEWDFGPGAHPRTHSGFGQVFVMFTVTGRQKITVNVTGPDCRSTETHYVDVEACSTSKCALEGIDILQHPANGNDDGVIELDMCVACGSTPPYRVFYTHQGRVVEAGPFR